MSSHNATYEIRYKQSAGSQNFTNIITNRTLLAYALLNLETDVRYTVEVSQIPVNSYCSYLYYIAVHVFIQGATN